MPHDALRDAAQGRSLTQREAIRVRHRQPGVRPLGAAARAAAQRTAMLATARRRTAQRTPALVERRHIQQPEHGPSLAKQPDQRAP